MFPKNINREQERKAWNIKTKIWRNSSKYFWSSLCDRYRPSLVFKLGIG